MTFSRIRRMLTGHEFGLSSQYGNVPLTLQCLQVVRNWQMPSNTVISVAPLNFSLYILNGVELLHNLPTLFTFTHVHYTHTPAVAVSGTCWAPWCEHLPPLSSAGERPAAAEGSLPLWDMGKLLLGKEKSESGVAEALSFGQAKFSAHMQRLWNRLFTQIKKKTSRW